MATDGLLPGLVRNFLPSSALGFAALALAVGLLWAYRDHSIGTRRRPGLKQDTALPLLGNLHQVAGANDRFNEYDLLRTLKFGPVYSFTVPGYRFIVINRPDMIEYVQSQKHRFENFEKGALMRNAMHDLLGSGIFSSDGETWLKQRKAASYIFSRNSFTGLIQRTVQHHVRVLVDVLNAKADQVIALDSLFMEFTLDAFLEMGFNQELGSMQSDKPVPFAKAFDRAQSTVCWRMVLPGWKVWEPLTPIGLRQRQDIKTIDDYVYSIIDAREREYAQREPDLLDLFMTIRNDAGQALDRQELRDAVLNLIIAGRDTTAQALAYVFFHITQNWVLYASKIREEAARVLGEGNDSVSYDQHKELVVVNAIFHEALRLHPSVSRNIKTAVEDDQIPGGPTINAGDVVYWSDWTIARLPDGPWGKDAAEFKPFERWIDADGKLRRYPQYTFHAFNAGPRLCLGQALATCVACTTGPYAHSYEAVAAIVGIVVNFDLRFKSRWLDKSPMCTGVVPDLPPTPQHIFSLTCPLKYPLEMIATPRKRT